MALAATPPWWRSSKKGEPGKEHHELWVTARCGGDRPARRRWGPQDETISPELHDGRPHPQLVRAFGIMFSCGIAQ